MDNSGRNDWWESENGIDLWSVPHFLFGVLAALAVPLFAIPFWPTLAATLVAAVLWEVFEKYIDIKESHQNQILDVAFAAIGFAITSLYLFQSPLSAPGLFKVCVGIFVVYGLFILFGWFAHRRRMKP